MYSESDDIQELFDGVDDHKMAQLAHEQSIEALQLDYAEEGKSIIEGYDKRINRVWKMFLLGSVGFMIISGSSWYAFQNTWISGVPIILAVLTLIVFPMWKVLIEHDQTVHQAINDDLVVPYYRVFGYKREFETSFSVFCWNATIKHKAGLLGIFALWILDGIHVRILGGRYRDPIQEQMEIVGENFIDIFQEEGIMSKVGIIRDKQQNFEEDSDREA